MKEKEKLGEKPLYGIWGFDSENLNLKGIFFLNKSGSEARIDFYGDTKIPEKEYFLDDKKPIYGSVAGKFILITEWYFGRFINNWGVSETLITLSIRFNFYFWSQETINFSKPVNKINYFFPEIKHWLPFSDELKTQSLQDIIHLNVKARNEFRFSDDGRFILHAYLKYSRTINKISIEQDGYLTETINNVFSPEIVYHRGLISEVLFSMLAHNKFPIERLILFFSDDTRVFLDFLKKRKNKSGTESSYRIGLGLNDFLSFLVSSPEFVTNFYNFFELRYPKLLQTYWFVVLRRSELIDVKFAFYYSWVERIIKDFFEKQSDEKIELQKDKRNNILSTIAKDDRAWLKKNVSLDLKDPVFSLQLSLSKNLGFIIVDKNGHDVFPKIKKVRDEFIHKDDKEESNHMDYANFNPILRIYLDALVLKLCGIGKDSLFVYAEKSIKGTGYIDHLFGVKKSVN